MTRKRQNRHELHQLKLEGEVTIYNAAAMKTTLLDAVRQHGAIEVDLANVSEMDSAGVQLLLLAKRESLKQEKALRLVRHSEAVLEIFNLYQVNEYFGDPVVLKRAK